MTERKGLRYSTRGIILFLLILGLLGVGALNVINATGLFRGDDALSRRYIDSHNFVYESLYNESDPDMDFIKYYIRAEKITNYPMTEEYSRSQPGTVVAQKVNGEYVYFQDRDEFDYNSRDDYFVKSNIDGYEEPIYGVNYLTNDWVFLQNYGEDYKFDPSTMKFKEGNVKTSGTWTRDSFSINDNIQQLGSREQAIHKKMNDSIKSIYSEIRPRDNGIIRLDFAYAIDANSPKLAQHIERQVIRDTYVPTAFAILAVAFLLVLGFGFITDFEMAEGVGFYKSISGFPIEIVLALTGILALPLALALEVSTSSYVYNLRWLFSGVLILAIFFGGIAILYLIHAFKSIYKNGFRSFVFQNGILYRAVKSVYNKGMNRVIGVTNNLEGTSKKNALLIYGSLILLGFMGTRWFVDYRRQNFVFILWVLLVTAIGAFLKKYFEDIKAIESASKFLAEGYYDVKVDENDTRFRTLAHNLNTVRNNLDSAVEDAIKSERMKTELITNVSHDLKTPLTSIINYSELIVDEEENLENIKEYAKVINEKSHRLKELIEGLFDLSKASSKNIDLDMEEIDLGQLLEQIYGEWEDKLTEKNITTNLNKPDEPVIIELDGTQTSRILENLFSNIYKYALENTRVYVDLYKEDGVKLIIKNISKYPLNISPEELMERFTRGDASRTTEGAGLGLSIASSLTEIQGGEFYIEIDGDLFKTTIVF